LATGGEGLGGRDGNDKEKVSSAATCRLVHGLTRRNASLSPPTLHERVGGVYAISAVVVHFSDQLVEGKHPRVREPTDRGLERDEGPYKRPGLKFLRTLWRCAIAGGPFEIHGPRPRADAHFDFQVTAAEFDEVAGVLADSLHHFHVPQVEKDEVLAAFAAYKPAVTAGSILRG
jgi:hemoglobin